MQLTITLNEREIVAVLKQHLEERGYRILGASIEVSDVDDRTDSAVTVASAVFKINAPSVVDTETVVPR